MPVVSIAICTYNRSESLQRTLSSLAQQNDNQQSGAGSNDPEKLRNRATAHRLILEHAVAAEIYHESSEMQHFARELFLLARQCGAAALAEEARILFELARQASGTERSRGIDFLLYGAGARLVGWRAMGSLTCSLDRLRS
jgi:hypothetical protein